MERRVGMKVSCTVWSRGKSGDNIKGLPIAILYPAVLECSANADERFP